MVNPPDVLACERLATRAITGDEEAFRSLWALLEPWVLGSVRSSRAFGALARSEDHARNAATELFSKLRQKLQRYPGWRASRSDGDFLIWLRTVTKHHAIDYVRQQRVKELATYEDVDEQGERPPFTVEATANEILDFAKTCLQPDRLAVLELWLAGATFEEIGERLGLSSRRAQAHQSAALALLRRRFRP